MAAPSSDQTKPSRVARSAPASQAMRACGPPMALMTSELTTKGPMPTISIMLRATASFRPRPRSSEGCDWASGEDGGEEDMSSENNKRAVILLWKAAKSSGKIENRTAKQIPHPVRKENGVRNDESGK